MGTAGAVLSNAQCSVNVTNARALVNGMTMTVTVPITFASASPVSGAFLQGFDVTGAYTGMTQVGNWVAGLPTTAAPGPAINGATLSATSGTSSVLSVIESHTAGTSQLSVVHIRVGSTITAPGVCHIIYFPGDNSLNLVADGETTLAGANVPLGSAGTLSNSRCSVQTSAASKSLVNANTLHLSVPVTFNPSTFDGDRGVYFNAFDSTGNLTHWVIGGIFRVQ